MHIENIVIGKPLVESKTLLAFDDEDWNRLEKDMTYFTEERHIAVILKELGVVKSISEVRKNKPEFLAELTELDCLNIKWGKQKFYVIVGE